MSDIRVMRQMLRIATTIKGHTRKQDATLAFNAKEDDILTCGFCDTAFCAKYTTHSGLYVPLNFIWLPEGMVPGDGACHICSDCHYVNRGLIDRDLQSIVQGTRARVVEGTAYEVALEQAILGWTFTHCSISGNTDPVRKAVRKQVEGYGDDGVEVEKPKVTPKATGEKSDARAVQIGDDDEVLEL